jgi:hypothetical protein
VRKDEKKSQFAPNEKSDDDRDLIGAEGKKE